MYNDTTAIILAYNGKIPPKYFEHDPNIINKDNKTVCDYL